MTGQATPWNPDVPTGTFSFGGGRLGVAGINAMEVGPDGYVYLSVGGAPIPPLVSGQPVSGGIVALSMITGRRLPWRPAASDWAAIVPGCLLQSTGCLPPAIGALAGVALGEALVAARGIFAFRLPESSGPWGLPALAAMMIAAGLLSAWLPARRALSIAPADALRAE